MKNLGILLLCLFWLGANATSWRVNNNPAINADFSTFQEAHDAASPGDTIYVEGTGFDNHYGDVTISKKLIVIGPGYFLLDNDSTQANHLVARFQAITLNSGAEGTVIYGLELNWGLSGYKGIIINTSNITIARNYFSDDRARIVFGGNDIYNIALLQNFAWEIRGTYGYSANNVLIANNFVLATISGVSSGVITNNVIKSGITSTYSEIKNNIIYQSSVYPLGGSSYGTENYVAYNLVSGTFHGGSNPPPPPGPGNQENVDMSTVFINFIGGSLPGVDNNWILNPEGPAVGAGENGIDCGMFGGVTPYVLSGLAPIPRIYEADVPISGSAATGLPVTIKVKSQN
ncbi:MAG TPA: hypothetical protein PK904_19425 [Bacteroidales bacterium]|nr:hypothetical protein [Bacteroidales bacterium]